MTSKQKIRVIMKLKQQMEVEAGKIRAARQIIERVSPRRDALIVKMLDAGMTEREVGALADLSGPRVHQIYYEQQEREAA